MKKIAKRLIALLCVMAMIATMIPADIMPVEAADVQGDSNTYKKVITSCDSKGAESNIVATLVNPNNINQSWGTGGTITSDTKVEGTASLGSYKAQSSTGTVANIFLANPVDVRGYKYFSVKLFVDNVDNMTADDNGGVLNVYLRTNDTPATTNVHLQFVISKDQLQSNSWVTLNLSFEQAISVSAGYDGRIDWLQFSLVNAAAGNVQFYIDDICAVNEEEGLLLYDCDQKTGKLAKISCNGNGEVETTNVKEGDGAWTSKVFKHSNGSYRVQTQIISQGAHNLDISDFVNDGYLQFWLYINKIDYMTQGLTIELGSGGAATTNSVHYTSYSKDKLNERWNLIQIPLNSSSSTYGTIDWSAINYFRLLAIGVAKEETMAEQYMLIDDIRVVDVDSEIKVREIVTGVITPAETTVPTMEGYVFGGYYDAYDSVTKKFSSPLTETREATTENPIYIKWVAEEVMSVKAQVRQNTNDDYKRVLTNCDGVGEASSNIAIADKTGNNKSGGKKCTDITYVKEGNASLSNSITLNTKKSDGSVNNPTFYNLFLEKPVDVRGYKYFSCQFYIPQEAYDNFNPTGSAIGILLSAEHSTNGKQSLIFYMTKNELNEGWNDIKLPFAQAGSISNTADGKYNGSAIDYIRILQYGNQNGQEVTVTTYLDDICVLNDNAGVLIADCDQMKAGSSTGFNNANAFTTVLQMKNNANSIIGDNKVEGTGALKAAAFANSSTNWRIMAPIGLSDANRLDISDYKDTGYLQFMLYINDKTNWSNKNFTVELKSNGDTDNQEINWSLSVNDLKENSWNVVQLPLSANDSSTQPKGYKTEGTDAFIWERVNFFRIFLNPVAQADVTNNNYILIDDIRVVDSIQVAACDSTSELKNTSTGTTVVETSNQKVGNGAFINTGNTGALAHSLVLKQAINFSGFKGKNGSLRFWVYIEKVSLMKSDYLLVELTSEGKRDDANDSEYYIPKTRLIDGWNEVYINLDIDTGLSDTTPSTLRDWTSVNCISIIFNGGFTSACTTMIDDITLVPGNKETVDVRFVSTVESLGYELVGYEIAQSRSSTKLITETKNVYKQLYKLGMDGISETFGPSDVSGLECSTYIHAATVANIPNRLWDATFTVTPYWQTQDGTLVKGAPQTYTINYLLNKSVALLEQDITILGITE